MQRRFVFASAARLPLHPVQMKRTHNKAMRKAAGLWRDADARTRHSPTQV